MVGLTFSGGVAAASAAPKAPSIRVTFTGTATGRLVDVERWVLLSSNECYLRRLRDQKTSLTWSIGFAGGRSLSATPAPTITGTVSGTEVRDSCDDVAEELPPEAPDDWLRSISCADPLATLRAGRASWSNGFLRLQAPIVAVAKTAVCTALPRSEELNARIPLPVSRITQLKRGAHIEIAVGSARPGTGTYRPRANCLHPAKPYDGYRSFDSCVDTMRWSGTVTVTRL
jgi:hypothetical protein